MRRTAIETTARARIKRNISNAFDSRNVAVVVVVGSQKTVNMPRRRSAIGAILCTDFMHARSLRKCRTFSRLLDLISELHVWKAPQRGR